MIVLYLEYNYSNFLNIYTGMKEGYADPPSLTFDQTFIDDGECGV